MRMRNTLAAAALIPATLTLTDCSAALEQIPAPSSSVPVDDVIREIGPAHSEAQIFWATQGITEVPGLQLVGVDETTDCGTETILPAKGREVVAAFCVSRNTILIWPEALAKQAELPVSQGAATDVVVAQVVTREYAQFAQHHPGVLPPGKTEKTKEPQADCLAGLTMREHHATALPSVEKSFNAIESILGRKDILHGDAKSRYLNFRLGFMAIGNDIRVCDSVIPLP